MEKSKADLRGFTLIELLVVIAIIAVLAAILFPVYVKVRDTGKRARCANNEKQLALALLKYCDDNGGRLPSVYSTSSYNDWRYDWWDYRIPRQNWARALLPHVKNFDVYKCPSSVAHNIVPVDDPRYSGNRKNCTSYLYNGLLLGPDRKSPPGPNIGKLWSACAHPSKTCWLRELKWYIQMAQTFPLPDGTGIDYYYNAAGHQGYECHDDGANYCFVDGHVRYLKWKAIPKDWRDPFWNFDDMR
jgi:prepilin-type N-terminal cleavage/methylation domain-containing protein/prepilin-type processing-associated H-X9-DG protein